MALTTAASTRRYWNNLDLLRKHIERTGTNVLKNLTKSGGA